MVCLHDLILTIRWMWLSIGLASWLVRLPIQDLVFSWLRTFIQFRAHATINIFLSGHVFVLGVPIPHCTGGGFQTGNSQVDAVPLMNASAGMIFVSIEYRLGQFGFLAGSTFAAANVSLNAGMLDQVTFGFYLKLVPFLNVLLQRTALMWIQRYISSFGGDPTWVLVL